MVVLHPPFEDPGLGQDRLPVALQEVAALVAVNDGLQEHGARVPGVAVNDETLRFYDADDQARHGFGDLTGDRERLAALIAHTAPATPKRCCPSSTCRAIVWRGRSRGC